MNSGHVHNKDLYSTRKQNVLYSTRWQVRHMYIKILDNTTRQGGHMYSNGLLQYNTCQQKQVYKKSVQYRHVIISHT